jgi:hypothetical protein
MSDAWKAMRERVGDLVDRVQVTNTRDEAIDLILNFFDDGDCVILTAEQQAGMVAAIESLSAKYDELERKMAGQGLYSSSHLPADLVARAVAARKKASR